MKTADRVAQAKKCIEFIATDYTTTNEEIAAALTELVKTISDFSQNLPAARKAHDDVIAAYRKRVADNQAEVLKTNGKLPEPTTASLGIPTKG